jgi:predicted benzoate:H+ symporter BenE
VRALAWLLTVALTAAGVLASHAAAYRVTGTTPGDVHGYLTHVPQLLAVVVTIALGALALWSRSPSVRLWPFPALALLGFAAQEHVERLLHTGQLPWLGTHPAFLVGLALQLPVALALWILARLLLRAVTEKAPRRAPPRISGLVLAIEPVVSSLSTGRSRPTAAARAPPHHLQAC